MISIFTDYGTDNVAALEVQLDQAHDLCATHTGKEHYERYDKRRCELLAEIEKHRKLTRYEFICLHGYQAWLDQGGVS